MHLVTPSTSTKGNIQKLQDRQRAWEKWGAEGNIECVRKEAMRGIRKTA